MREFERLVQKLDPGALLVRAWPLTGGISAQVTALEIAPILGEPYKVVVRQHGPADLAFNPNIACDEYRLLATLKAAGLPVPAPIYLDTSNAVFVTPVIVAEFIDGSTAFAPLPLNDALEQMAAALAQIHRVVVPTELSFLPRQVETVTDVLRERPHVLDASLDEERIRDALGAVWPLPPRNPVRLLHGDYWPGNIFWRDGKLAAVLDWEDAALGDPLDDLAIMRLELLWNFGVKAMNEFTRRYQARTSIDLTDLSYWDLCAALRPCGRIALWAADAEREAVMRDAHRQFRMQAFEALVRR
jgi:aminoglycoside phosphotransferase (APT) family kinase protein